MDRQVRVIIITRYVDNVEDRNTILLSTLMQYSLKYNDIFQIFKYNYNGDIYESSTFHAKAIVVDYGKRAYIGSANITGWGLEQQLELGVLIEDRNARVLYDVIKYLQKASIIERCFF